MSEFDFGMYFFTVCVQNYFIEINKEGIKNEYNMDACIYPEQPPRA